MIYAKKAKSWVSLRLRWLSTYPYSYFGDVDLIGEAKLYDDTNFKSR